MGRGLWAQPCGPCAAHAPARLVESSTCRPGRTLAAQRRPYPSLSEGVSGCGGTGFRAGEAGNAPAPLTAHWPRRSSFALLPPVVAWGILPSAPASGWGPGSPWERPDRRAGGSPSTWRILFRWPFVCGRREQGPVWRERCVCTGHGARMARKPWKEAASFGPLERPRGWRAWGASGPRALQASAPSLQPLL